MFRTFTDNTEAARTPAVSAELIGSDTASAASITARGAAPVLQLCRLLVAAGIDPGRPLHAYRHNNVLCLIVCSIGEGAKLTVDESRTAFARWKAFPHAAVSPRSAPFERAPGAHCANAGDRRGDQYPRPT
jgi:hypothetical protein